MEEKIFYYCCLLSVLVPCLIVLIVILYDMNKNKNITFTRSISYPPKKIEKL